MPHCFLGRPRERASLVSITRSPRVSRADHSRSFASASFSKREAAPREYFPRTVLHRKGGEGERCGSRCFSICDSPQSVREGKIDTFLCSSASPARHSRSEGGPSAFRNLRL